MVKLNRASVGAGVARKGCTLFMKLRGKTLSRRTVTRTVDSFSGKITAVSNADEDFTGDLQYGLDLDQRFVNAGIVEVGDAILYTEFDALSPLPEPQEIIVDGNSQWEILQQIESPEVNGSVTFFAYRCKRRIIDNDS